MSKSNQIYLFVFFLISMKLWSCLGQKRIFGDIGLSIQASIQLEAVDTNIQCGCSIICYLRMISIIESILKNKNCSYDQENLEKIGNTLKKIIHFFNVLFLSKSQFWQTLPHPFLYVLVTKNKNMTFLPSFLKMWFF